MQYITPPSHPRYDHLNNIWRRVLWSSSWNFLPPLVTFRIFGPDILLNTLSI
jgi:hypothetical protein